MDEICFSCRKEANKGRAVLVICNTIAEVKEICSKLKLKRGLKVYDKNNTNQEKHIAKVYGGDIIVATNLAGRGTDIKTDQNVEKNGGLHVIITFMPLNQRVLEQAFGRTARQENVGTAQMILNKKSPTLSL